MNSVRENQKPRQRKPVERRLTLITPPQGETALILDVGGALCGYWLKEIPSEIGGRAFELRKAESRGGEIYHVLLKGIHSSCSCPAGTFRPHTPCKHYQSLVRAIDKGLLPVKFSRVEEFDAA